MTAKEKNKLAGICLMAHGGFLALIYLLMIGFVSVFFRDDSNAIDAFLIFALTLVAISAIVFVVPQIVGGWKMYKERPNAKNWGVVGAIFACMNMPLGTAAGVFVLIFLFGDDGNNFYSNRTNQKYLGEMNAVDEFQFNDRREKQPYDWR